MNFVQITDFDWVNLINITTERINFLKDIMIFFSEATLCVYINEI